MKFTTVLFAALLVAVNVVDGLRIKEDKKFIDKAIKDFEKTDIGQVVTSADPVKEGATKIKELIFESDFVNDLFDKIDTTLSEGSAKGFNAAYGKLGEGVDAVGSLMPDRLRFVEASDHARNTVLTEAAHSVKNMVLNSEFVAELFEDVKMKVGEDTIASALASVANIGGTAEMNLIEVSENSCASSSSIACSAKAIMQQPIQIAQTIRDMTKIDVSVCFPTVDDIDTSGEFIQDVAAELKATYSDHSVNAQVVTMANIHASFGSFKKGIVEAITSIEKLHALVTGIPKRVFQALKDADVTTDSIVGGIAGLAETILLEIKEEFMHAKSNALKRIMDIIIAFSDNTTTMGTEVASSVSADVLMLKVAFKMGLARATAGRSECKTMGEALVSVVEGKLTKLEKNLNEAFDATEALTTAFVDDFVTGMGTIMGKLPVSGPIDTLPARIPDFVDTVIQEFTGLLGNFKVAVTKALEVYKESELEGEHLSNAMTTSLTQIDSAIDLINTQGGAFQASLKDAIKKLEKLIQIGSALKNGLEELITDVSSECDASSSFACPFKAIMKQPMLIGVMFKDMADNLDLGACVPSDSDIDEVEGFVKDIKTELKTKYVDRFATLKDGTGVDRIRTLVDLFKASLGNAKALVEAMRIYLVGIPMMFLDALKNADVYEMVEAIVEVAKAIKDKVMEIVHQVKEEAKGRIKDLVAVFTTEADSVSDDVLMLRVAFKVGLARAMGSDSAAKCKAAGMALVAAVTGKGMDAAEGLKICAANPGAALTAGVDLRFATRGKSSSAMESAVASVPDSSMMEQLREALEKLKAGFTSAFEVTKTLGVAFVNALESGIKKLAGTVKTLVLPVDGDLAKLPHRAPAFVDDVLVEVKTIIQDFKAAVVAAGTSYMVVPLPGVFGDVLNTGMTLAAGGLDTLITIVGKAAAKLVYFIENDIIKHPVIQAIISTAGVIDDISDFLKDVDVGKELSTKAAELEIHALAAQRDAIAKAEEIAAGVEKATADAKREAERLAQVAQAELDNAAKELEKAAAEAAKVANDLKRMTEQAAKKASDWADTALNDFISWW